MNLLSQNAKMKKSSQNGIELYNFGIPAFRSETGLATCPNAGHCASGCYARSGTYNFSNVARAYEARLQVTQSDTFVMVMIAEVNLKLIQARSKGRSCLIRIHDSGDFYSKDYAKKWFTIMKHFANDTDCKFYAYTKMVTMFEELKSQNEIPNNFNIIYSYGGKQDSQIDTTKHRHSKVFENETDLLAQGYSDASNDDLVAALGSNPKIGLVYHGTKKYTNTTWSKVS